MDFPIFDVGEGKMYSPYSGKDEDGNWLAGAVSIEYLQSNFGQFSTASEMIDATESEGLKLFFAWLRDEGKLQ